MHYNTYIEKSYQNIVTYLHNIMINGVLKVSHLIVLLIIPSVFDNN